MNHSTMLPGDIAAAKFDATIDTLDAACVTLTAAFPGSSWRVEAVGAGYVNGRVGIVEVDLHIADDGSWSATAHPSHEGVVDQFGADADGADAVELARELVEMAWEMMAMASECAA